MKQVYRCWVLAVYLKVVGFPVVLAGFAGACLAVAAAFVLVAVAFAVDYSADQTELVFAAGVHGFAVAEYFVMIRTAEAWVVFVFGEQRPVPVVIFEDFAAGVADCVLFPCVYG